MQRLTVLSLSYGHVQRLSRKKGNIEKAAGGGDGGSFLVTGKTHGSPNPGSGNAYVDEQSLLEAELGFFKMIDAVEGKK